MMLPIDLQEDKQLGNIEISPDVIEVIAGLATIEVPGVAGMSGGMAGDIAELLGRKNLAKGVSVEVGQTETAVNVSIIIEYGASIPDVASAIQENVKREIENMTSLKVVEVNVNVEGVDFKVDDASATSTDELKLK